MKLVKVLAISSLYPNEAMPRRGIFTEHRLRSLNSASEIDSIKMISPLPSFPTRDISIAPYHSFKKVPDSETRHGIDVFYPRYLNIPKFGMHVQPRFMAMSLSRTITRILDSGFEFDVIDAFYMYPDGVAAAIVSETFKKPLVMTAYGSDISLIAANSSRAARRITWAADRAKACTTVCQALKDALIGLNVDPSKIHVVLHGVDLNLFRPADELPALRARLGFHGTTFVTAGHLIELKGIHFVISALKHLPEVNLIVAGDGPDENKLKRLAVSEGVAGRVEFLGNVEQEELRNYFAAADAFVLMSSREGIANVIMESLACGTPVLATAVWGAPEIITVPEAGKLIPQRSVSALVQAAKSFLKAPPDRTKTRTYAERFTWERTTREHLDVYRGFL